tara:strand:- start:21443 stop:21619 length:177 start_codon:yes stop_codon:yes gene_type:complete
MSTKESELNRLIDKLCDGQNEEYKIFIKKMLLSMSDGDKWAKLSKLNDLTAKIKTKKN